MTTRFVKELERGIIEHNKRARRERELRDPMPEEDGPDRWAWRKRQEREYMRRAGYIKIEAYFPPRLWKKVEPWLMDYSNGHPPRGKALLSFLEDLEFEDEEP